MLLRRFASLAILVSWLVVTTPTLAGRDREALDFDRHYADACERIASLGPVGIEGVWRFGPNGKVVTIERADPQVESLPDVAPARYVLTVIGNNSSKSAQDLIVLSATGFANMYEMSVTSPKGNVSRFLATLTDEAHLSLESKRKPYRFSPLVVLRSFFLTPMEHNRVQRPTAGLQKLFPATPTLYSSPRYL